MKLETFVLVLIGIDGISSVKVYPARGGEGKTSYITIFAFYEATFIIQTTNFGCKKAGESWTMLLRGWQG